MDYFVVGTQAVDESVKLGTLVTKLKFDFTVYIGRKMELILLPNIRLRYNASTIHNFEE